LSLQSDLANYWPGIIQQFLVAFAYPFERDRFDNADWTYCSVAKKDFYSL